MTSFGTWLGKENGKTMVGSAITESGCDLSKEQVRCVVTTYCILFDIEVDTYDWDELMRYIWEYYNSWFNTYEELDDYMCEYLV